MSRGVNKVILLGNLGDAPEVKFMPSGKAVANFSVATMEEWKDKNTGEKVSKTEWHKIVAWSRLAEICGEYLKKGSKVYLEGKLQTRKWQTQDGQDRYTTEVLVHEMQMLDAKDASPRPATDKVANAQDKVAQKPKASKETAVEEFDDDIPF